MKTFGSILLLVASVSADTYLSANQVFCNCGDAENSFYNSYMDAENACANQAAGAGYSSCVAIELGFVSTTVEPLNSRHANTQCTVI